MASLTKHWLPAYEIQRHKRADIHFVEARVGISKKVASAERLEIYTGQCVRVPPSNLQQIVEGNVSFLLCPWVLGKGNVQLSIDRSCDNLTGVSPTRVSINALPLSHTHTHTHTLSSTLSACIRCSRLGPPWTYNGRDASCVSHTAVLAPLV